MRSKINAYIAVLFITIAGAGASLMIIRVAEHTNFDASNGYNAASYHSLETSILEQG